MKLKINLICRSLTQAKVVNNIIDIDIDITMEWKTSTRLLFIFFICETEEKNSVKFSPLRESILFRIFGSVDRG